VKQCGRVVVPVIERPRPFAEVTREISGHDAALLCWEGGGQPLHQAVPRAVEGTGRVARLLLLVGPEGGFTSEEVTLAESAGARLVSLGPRILRAESAGVTVVAICQYRFGDLGGDRSAASDGGAR
jgi:16S rRNA (uracil1498-N3)-methyltransferase